MHRHRLFALTLFLAPALGACHRSCSSSPDELSRRADGGAWAPGMPSIVEVKPPPLPESSAKPTVFPLGTLPADAPFEGRLELRVELHNEENDELGIATYHFTLKGGKLRWDIFGDGG